jgi:hypothetical protein
MTPTLTSNMLTSMARRLCLSSRASLPLKCNQSRGSGSLGQVARWSNVSNKML